MTTRAVSTTLGFVLTLTITTVLISGIMVAASGFVTAEHERVTEAELEVVGQRLAANVESVDRVVSSSNDQTALVVDTRLELPNRVAGTTYRIQVNTTSSELVLRSADPEVTVRVPIETTTSLKSSSVDAGDVTVTYDRGADQLEVTNG